MAAVKKVAPDCARKDCGHGRGVHRKKTIRKRVLIKCTVPGCACRTYLEPLPDGKPRPTAPNADKKYPAEVLTPDEIQAMIRLCDPRWAMGVRNRALLWLLYRSGLRLAEAVGDRDEGVMGLRPADVNFADHSLRVLHGKGDKATTRFFHPSAEEALAQWIGKRRELGFGDERPLFCTLEPSPAVEPGPHRPKGSPARPKGSPLHPQYVRNLVHRLGAKAGIAKRVHPHALRHTYAAELARAGMPIDAISRLLGHDSVATTATYLQGLINADAGLALEALSLPELDTGGRKRTLKVETRDTPDGPRHYGTCSACSTVFEPGVRIAKRDVRGFLLPAFGAHECHGSREEEAEEITTPKPRRRPKATGNQREEGQE